MDNRRRFLRELIRPFSARVGGTYRASNIAGFVCGDTLRKPRLVTRADASGSWCIVHG
jgi:hypothetical protein